MVQKRGIGISTIILLGLRRHRNINAKLLDINKNKIYHNLEELPSNTVNLHRGCFSEEEKTIYTQRQRICKLT